MSTPVRSDSKFRNSRGWLKPYAFACGYQEKAEHPKDSSWRVYMSRQSGGSYEVIFLGPGHNEMLYCGPMLKLARGAYSRARRTLVVKVALIKAGVGI